VSLSSWAMFSKIIPQVSIGCIFNDDKQRATLAATAQQIDDIHMFSNHFHHFHLTNQIFDIRVSVVLCKNQKLMT
jgi:hypothetical protein